MARDEPDKRREDGTHGTRRHRTEGKELMSFQRRLEALVVEDDPGVRRFVNHVLALEGFSVASAADASEAFDHLAAGHRFDLLVTDYEMPRITGMVLAVEFRKYCPDARVVLMTGAIHKLTWPADLHGAFDHLLEKPFGLERLRSILLEVREKFRPGRADDGRSSDAKRLPGRSG